MSGPRQGDLRGRVAPQLSIGNGETSSSMHNNICKMSRFSARRRIATAFGKRVLVKRVGIRGLTEYVLAERADRLYEKRKVCTL